MARPAPHRGRIAISLLIVGAAAGFWPNAPLHANDPFTSGTLEIRGARLTIYSDALVDDADQVVNIGERPRVRTCFGGTAAPCGGADPGDPLIAGLEVRGELRGPELPQPITLTTVPGGAFLLPAFQQQGDYFLENIRLVETATGAVLGDAEPPIAVLRVRQILLASASVATLSLEDLAARGIAITSENFQAFGFSVGFLFGSELVTIDLPVLYEGGGVVQVLDSPTVQLDGLPSDVAHTVSRWQPPSIVPFTLEVAAPDTLDVGEEPYVPITFPIFGAIVMPGNVSFLNQFFDARLIVANGAPVGSSVELDNLAATLRLPSGNVLRVAATEPAVAPGQQVPMMDALGSSLIAAGGQASASWTVEGLAAGTHALQMDVTGELVRPGKTTVPVTTRAQAAVEVVDARFHLVFSHPDVIREGSAYSLFVTVTNLSRATQNLISVEIDDPHITGAHKEDPADDFRRSIDTLEPGGSETLEYRLVADVTGKVVGGSFESTGSSGGGAIRLYTGVGELGIPLSPATLRLPRFSERLAEPYIWTSDYYRAATRFLGLAYSLAVAPAGMTPPGLPSLIRSDVETRAADLGFAGQRTFLGEELLESLEALLLDQLGNREPLAEIDDLRRSTEKGLAISVEIARLLRHEQEARGLDASDLLDHLGGTTAHSGPYVAAMVVPAFAADPPVLEVRRLTEGGWTFLARTGEETDALRSLAFGEIFAVSENPTGGAVVPLAVVGHAAPDQLHEIYLHNVTGTAAEGRLILVVCGGAGNSRRIDFGSIIVPPHSVYGVSVSADMSDPAKSGFVMVDVGTGDPVGGLTVTADPVALPPFRLLGARQDYGIASGANRYGQGISYLFNRPPDAVAAERAESFAIRSTFDTGTEALVSDKLGSQAFLQPSGRVVSVRYSSPLSALVADPLIGAPLVVHEHLIDRLSIVDELGEALNEPIPDPTIEFPPEHRGGLVAGKVLRGTGAPAANATVQLIRPRLVDTGMGFKTVLDLVGEMTTGADGAFYFDMVEQPHPDPFVQDRFTLRAIVPAGADPVTEPAALEEVSSTIHHFNQVTTINIALLGRGTVKGELLYLDTGEPVPQGTVTVSSTLFHDTATVTVGADGAFEVPAMPVGPLTLTGRDLEGRVVYATVGLAQPGDVVHIVLELPRTQPPGLGTVVGTVLRQPAGGPPPPPEAVAGATVEVNAGGASLGLVETDAFGRFRFDDVPAGQVTVQAADWRVSRTSVLTDLILAADEIAEVTLTLPQSATRSVTGNVLYIEPGSNKLVPVANAPVFISGPGVFAYTAGDGSYRIDGVPVQAAGSSSYRVAAIDTERSLEGSVELLPILDSSPEVVGAQNIVLREMQGGIVGVVLDPLGLPFAGAKVVAVRSGTPYVEISARSDGSFSIDDLPLGEWTLVAHAGNGLEEGRVGYFGESAPTAIVFGGHRPFASVRMVGSGVAKLQVSSASGGDVWAEVFYHPTYFSETAKSITRKGVAIDTETDPNGALELALPVGAFEIVVFSPLHGLRRASGRIDWAGQVKNVDVVFDGSSTVTGRLVNVDGVTPIPNFEVELSAGTLLPQSQRTNAEGRFLFEFVPEGRLMVRAGGLVGSVERVGVATGVIGGGGQTLDLTVRMKAQGTVEGRVLERVGDQNVPLAGARVYVAERSYPFRRLPAHGGVYTADSEGRYRVSHVYAGGVRVVAEDGNATDRRGSAKTAIESDWQVVQAPDIVITTSVASVGVTIRDPDTGAVLPDTQVTIRGAGNIHELTVADGFGVAIFEALPLGTYSVTAFHAPTGRSGRVDGVALVTPGQHLERTLYVDRRGSVGGTLYDDPPKTLPVPGATVRLEGQTAGGPLTALDTTGGRPENLGRFDFFGIPEGHYQLTAGVADSARRAGAEVTLTATAPVAEIDMVLEPAGDVAFRVFESLAAGLGEVDPSTVLLSVRLQQGPTFDFTRLQPQAPSPGHHYLFPGVLLERGGTLTVQELGGEQRQTGMSAPNFLTGVPLAGHGTAADPYRVVLSPKGVVRVTVRDAASVPVADAEVTVVASGGVRFPSVTGADGTVVFSAVPAGDLMVTASAPHLGVGGRSTASLVFDDDVIDVAVGLQASVSAHGFVYQPLPGDVYNGDPSILVPQDEAVVEFDYPPNNKLVMTTGPDGAYGFDALPEGAAYSVTARSQNGQAVASTGGTLAGPDGNDNEVAQLILDGGPPQIVSIVPPPGMEGVSRTAAVEIVFSEPLLAAVLPTGGPTSAFFEVRGPSGTAAGSWISGFDSDGRQIVRFVPSTPYANNAIHSLVIEGGPGGVRDRSGRPLSANGDVGSNFTTSDAVGPAVIGSVPDLGRPVDPEAPIRFDFNESLVATDEQLDGDGAGDAAVLSWGQSDGGGGAVWQPLPATLLLTRGGYSLTVKAVEGLTLTDDTLLRRVEISGLEDSQGNVMAPYERQFRIRDANAPVIDELLPPPTAPDGRLSAGRAYTVTPALSAIDHFPLDPPKGDIDRVEYFFEDPSTAGDTAQPGAIASAPPYAFSFVAAYSGNGIDPRPFPVWARAVDTSTNVGNVVELPMDVLPNEAPVIGTVTATAVAPVAGVFYAGSTIRATVEGVGDVDGSQLALNVRLVGEGGGVITSAPTLSLPRPVSGVWTDLPAPTLDLAIPISQPEGAALHLSATVTDASGASAAVESGVFNVADDSDGPVIEGIVVRSAADGAPASLFHIGEGLYVDFEARDIETGVATAVVTFDRGDILTSPLTATRVGGDLWRSPVVTVPAGAFTGQTTIEATATADDRGGNSSTAARTFEVAPEPDPTAPTVVLLTPWEDGPWPAGYTSGLSPGVGVALLLRAQARDLDVDGDGNEIPGSINTVTFRGPVDDGLGGLALAADPVPGTLVAGTGGAGQGVYEAVWPVPDQIAAGVEVPFEVRVVDNGNLEVVRVARMRAVPYRKVYEGALTPVLPDDTMLAADGAADGDVFLLDGTTLSIYPQTDGSVRFLEGVSLYAGAFDGGGGLTIRRSMLTASEINNYGETTLFRPLELEIGRVFAVGAGSTVDVSRRGLLGGTGSDEVVLPGETAAGPRAGGSHGGAGWFGAPDEEWEAANLFPPSSTHDSVRDPRLPGAGGGGWGSTAGGNGGGVFRLDAGDAEVRLAGDVRADGGGSHTGGGAGGSVRIVAGNLLGEGLISANGGDSDDQNRAGGGGGGRLAILYRELADEIDLDAQTEALGGGNGGTFLAGAGTIYVEQLDPAKDGATGVGRLLLDNPTGLPAAPTLLPAIGDGIVTAVDPATATISIDGATGRGVVIGDELVVEDAGGSLVATYPVTGQSGVGGALELEVDATVAELEDLQVRIGAETLSAHGRTRYAGVRAAGVIRLAFDDDLVIGAADDLAPAVNDPTAITLEGGARAILRGDQPAFQGAVTPAAGSEVLVGSTIQVSWATSDPVGLWEIGESWTPTGSSTFRRHQGQPLAVGVDPNPLTLTVPGTAQPGPAVYRVAATDVAGRTATPELSWTVLPNETPTGSLAFADGAPVTVQAGFATTVVVHAEDREGLASVTLSATGPAVEPTQTKSVGGTAQDLTFDVAVTPTADGATPIVLQATINDISGATVMTGTLEVTVTPDLNLPTVAIDLAPPAAGDLYTAGTPITITATTADDVGVGSFSVTFDGATTTTAGEPIVVLWVAPEVYVDTSFEIAVEAHDLAGNIGTASRTLIVQPLINPAAPVVSILCPVYGDYVAAGFPLTVDFSISDDDLIQKYSLLIDGSPIRDRVTVDDTTFRASVAWTPPIDGQPGDEFEIRLEAADYAGNKGITVAKLTIPVATLLTGDQSLTSNLVDGEVIALVAGVMTAVEPLNPETLILIQGASLVGELGEAFELTASDRIHVSCGAAIDVTGLGYEGGNDLHPDGYAPPWVEAPQAVAGGSHGGSGSEGSHGGLIGEVFDSVYQPRLAGGGGSSDGYTDGGPGGGALAIIANDLVLNGVLRASGSAQDDLDGSSGAGGTISITVHRLAGPGTIDASGGSQFRRDGNSYLDREDRFFGVGGGGRVSLTADILDGFIIPDQVSASAGPLFDHSGNSYPPPGGSGTVFVRTPDSVFGSLLVASPFVGERLLYPPREQLPTGLPPLGEGTVGALQVEGPDAWVTTVDRFPPRWLGAWMTLLDASGSAIGSYRVAEIDDLGNALLEEAAAATSAVEYRGEYRFDRVDLLPGARLLVDDPLWTSHLGLTNGSQLAATVPIRAEIFMVEGEAVLMGDVVADWAEIPDGATLRTVPGYALQLSVSGTLTVAAGGTIDVTGQGFTGADVRHPVAEAPPDVRAAGDDAAGSHGGLGSSDEGTEGESYGSLFEPTFAGGGGGETSYDGAPGGGAVVLTVGSLVLDGSIRADGGRPSNSSSCGAGGSVLLDAGQVSGSGEISAVGGSHVDSDGGGGGRIALYVDVFDGFDPLTQVIANGGARLDGNGVPIYRYGGHGTVFIHQPGMSNGNLYIGVGDCGGIPVDLTPLTGIGRHVVGVAEADPGQPSDVWIEPEDPGAQFALGVVGLWVRVNGSDYRVVEQENRRRILVEAAAGSIQPGDDFEGIAKLDTITVAGCANVIFGDTTEYQSLIAGPDATATEVNSDPPFIDPDLIHVTALGGTYWISGDPGAVTDDNGIDEVIFRYVSSGNERTITWNADGSLEPFEIIGVDPGDEWAIDARDVHPLPLVGSRIFVFPANQGPPEIDSGLIEFVDQGGGLYYLRGLPGSVSDPDQRIWVEVRVVSTGSVLGTGAYADSDGSFWVRLVASPPHDEPVQVEATDDHPDPQTAVLELGVIPDLIPPEIDSDRVLVQAADRAFHVRGFTGAVSDDVVLDSAELIDPAVPGVPVALAVAADGSFASVIVDSPTGTVLTLRAVDGGGNEATAALDPLPANDGPPEIYTSYMSRTISGGSYTIETNGNCIWLKTRPSGCNYPLGAYDGIEVAYVENRTTPGFGPFSLVVSTTGCGPCGGYGYQFDPVTVAGAVGDEIWMVVEDGHPEWLASEALVWTLPVIQGAPAVALDSGDLVFYGGGYHLIAPAGVITDPDGPLTAELESWRQTAGVWSVVFTDTRPVASGEAFDVEIIGGVEGDLVVVAVTDVAGLTTTVRVGPLPAPQAITASFEQAGYTVAETTGEVLLGVSLSEPPATTVTVDYRTIAGSAEADIDYQHTDGTLVFGPGDTERFLEVLITDDGFDEDAETFQVELYDPVGIDLGTSGTADVTIHGDAGGVITVAYSVRVDVGNMLPAPIGVDISGGVATFAADLPEGPDRGDKVTLDILGPVFIVGCADDRHCTVTDSFGLPPTDVTEALATAIEPSFGSLGDAVYYAGDDFYLETFDLVAANRSLEIVCYGGSPDTDYVELSDWVTSPENDIRIVAPTAAGMRGPSQRHSGRWSDQAYRLEVSGDHCINVQTGNLTIEGLQLYCEGDPDYPLYGIWLDGIEGDVEIAETLIRLDGAAAEGNRIGILTEAATPVEVVVRNSMLWDIGDGSQSYHVGILVEDGDVTLVAANNTILGGAHGIGSDFETTLVTNNLLLDMTEYGFWGWFSDESAANLTSDGWDAHDSYNVWGPLTIKNPDTGEAADLHLGCSVMDQDVTITHDFDGQDISRIFDNDTSTLINDPTDIPAWVRLEFAAPRTISGTAVEVSHHGSHDWMVAAADSEEDLDTESGSYRELVEWRTAANQERAWDGVAFDSPETAYFFELRVERGDGDQNLHLNEWWLDGLNPACGAGVDLSAGPGHAFAIDVDSVVRTDFWDIGADQNHDLTVGFPPPPVPYDWWEAEGHARLQVVLSEPSPVEISVRYRTEDDNAYAGEDYEHTEGVLVFAPGEVSKIISVPLIDDGTGDDDEWFGVRLTDAAGARLDVDWWWIHIVEGDPPVRIRLAETLVEVPESDDAVYIGVELSRVHTDEVGLWSYSFDGSAHIGPDFYDPYDKAVIPAGQTQTETWFRLTDDGEAEPSEYFSIEGIWPANAEVGVPKVGIIRIVDDDGKKGTP